jgi:non-haem dioxygenase in morphine synthesis N-terminal
MATSLAEDLSSVEFIQVESVQTLASNLGGSSHEVPDQYIRPEVEADTVVEKGSFDLPVIDLARLRDPQFSEAEIAKLSYACAEWGFFQVGSLLLFSNCVDLCIYVAQKYMIVTIINPILI